MSARLIFTILGCGSSGGVPRLGGLWGDCDPENPKNRRQRCSMLIERESEAGTTRVLIDTSPDMRAQLLAADVGELDAVVYTHSHADHVHGIDDLRMVVFNMRKRIPVWADGPTQQALYSRFDYAFVQPDDSPYPPILDMHTIKGDIEVTGEGGMIELTPIRVNHGSMDALAFRVEGLCYMPDVAEIYDEAWTQLQGLDCWVLDTLRRAPHPTHAHFEKSLEWIRQVAPRRAVLTNMHNDLDYDTVSAETPDHITPAYDGMRIVYDL
ncbi:MBL fold metallo-hydrolase [Shimia biformata]|uniref:MBL fold metallo-hydrolase n=1 Tax=Shimia biformata TaxID=1294299 RepID=UPI00194DCF7C|nr:MBL fold metallo-hydrolase [Shimia biformata]